MLLKIDDNTVLALRNAVFGYMGIIRQEMQELEKELRVQKRPEGKASKKDIRYAALVYQHYNLTRLLQELNGKKKKVKINFPDFSDWSRKKRIADAKQDFN
mgnify:CR=1 FL=1